MTMLHADELQIERLVHGERIDADVRTHVDACAECRSRLDAARADDAAISALLRHIDHAAPRITADSVINRARGNSAGWGRWAAGIALTLGVAGIAYAVPGSLRDWLEAPTPTDVVSPPAPPRIEPDAGGLNAIPGARFTIVIAPAHGTARAIVSLIDGDTIRARSGDAATTFTSELDDRWLIDTHSSPVDVVIAIPRSASRVEIWVGDRRVLLKAGAEIVTDSPLDSTGRYLLPLHAP